MTAYENNWKCKCTNKMWIVKSVLVKIITGFELEMEAGIHFV